MLRDLITSDSSALSYLKTRNGLIYEVNSTFLELTRYYEADIMHRPISAFFKEVLKITYSLSDYSHLEESIECFIFTKNFETREVIISTHNTPFADEKIYIFKEKPFSRLESKFSIINKLIEDNHVGIGIYSSPDLILLKANQRYLNILDEPYNKKECSLGLKLVDMIPWNTVGSAEEIWMNIINSGDTYYGKEIKGITGTWKNNYCDNTIIPVVENGKVKYVVSMIEDVTEKVLARKHNEEQAKIIQQQKEQLETIIENMSDALFILDKEGRFVIMNAEARRIYQQELSEISGQGQTDTKYYDEYGNQVSLKEMSAFRALSGEFAKSERIVIKRPEKFKIVDVNVAPLYDKNGSVSMVVVCSRDITERVEAEIEKENTLNEAIRMKDEFLSIISHEFKTPLNVINSAIQTMELICGNELSDKAKGFITKIKQNSLRQLRLVNNLLEITRINAGQIKIHKKNQDIVFITRSIIDSVLLYAQNKGVKLTFSSSIPKKIVGIDEEKYERILLNLLSNAIKFTPKGKCIAVKIHSKNGSVCIEVKDNGLGIPEDKLKLIFERFGQVDSSLSRQAEGTGIGLSLVKLFVEAMGGSISVTSKLGEGSTFTLLLPAAKVSEDEGEKNLKEFTDNRLIQAIYVEFSDIYLN